MTKQQLPLDPSKHPCIDAIAIDEPKKDQQYYINEAKEAKEYAKEAIVSLTEEIAKDKKTCESIQDIIDNEENSISTTNPYISDDNLKTAQRIINNIHPSLKEDVRHLFEKDIHELSELPTPINSKPSDKPNHVLVLIGILTRITRNIERVELSKLKQIEKCNAVLSTTAEEYAQKLESLDKILDGRYSPIVK